jgi:hypothetical protein
MPPEQWPHSFYPPFASGCGFVISHDLVAWLVGESSDFTFFRVIDVPVGIYLACLPHVHHNAAPPWAPTLGPCLGPPPWAPALGPCLGPLPWAPALAPHPGPHPGPPPCAPTLGPTLGPCLGPDGRSASAGLGWPQPGRVEHRARTEVVPSLGQRPGAAAPGSRESLSCARRQLPDREERLNIVHLETIRPYRPLPIYREDTIVQHYMQPEEFRQFFDSAYGGAAKTEAEQESDARIAQVYDLFVGAKVMRR